MLTFFQTSWHRIFQGFFWIYRPVEALKVYICIMRDSDFVINLFGAFNLPLKSRNRGRHQGTDKSLRRCGYTAVAKTAHELPIIVVEVEGSAWRTMKNRNLVHYWPFTVCTSSLMNSANCKMPISTELLINERAKMNWKKNYFNISMLIFVPKLVSDDWHVLSTAVTWLKTLPFLVRRCTR